MSTTRPISATMPGIIRAKSTITEPRSRFEQGAPNGLRGPLRHPARCTMLTLAPLPQDQQRVRAAHAQMDGPPADELRADRLIGVVDRDAHATARLRLSVRILDGHSGRIRVEEEGGGARRRDDVRAGRRATGGRVLRWVARGL